MIVPWIQIHIDKAFAEVERLHPITARIMMLELAQPQSIQ